MIARSGRSTAIRPGGKPMLRMRPSARPGAPLSDPVESTRVDSVGAAYTIPRRPVARTKDT
jgi:hypothetical protein